jgi:NAD+ synthase (glutamine-hydrolysing)
VPALRLALAQFNSIVGALDANAAAISHWSELARERGAGLLVTPELALSGYPPEDLLLKQGFLLRCSQVLDDLVAASGDLTVALGAPLTLQSYELELAEPADARSSASVPSARTSAPIANALAIYGGARLIDVAQKRLLPNYDVFDEQRYFRAATGAATVLDIGGVLVGFLVCEDIWSAHGPALAASRAGARLLVVANASPFARGRQDDREAVVRQRALETNCAVAYVNMVGGQDELVFDGQSFVVNSHGELVARSAAFTEALLVVDIHVENSSVEVHVASPMSHTLLAPRMSDLAEIYEALVVGTRDYLIKNGFSNAVVNLSGGIDSAIVAVVAADALGAEHVRCFGLPSRYSSEGSLADATELARRTGIQFETLPIEGAHHALATTLLGALDETPSGLTDENLQSRIRGLMLMAISNATGAIALTTGNKSELATGYFTLYGDSVGGFAVIKDVSKTLVYELCQWRNDEAVARGQEPPIPQTIIDKAPSAELRPDQRDDQSLPPYDVLDPLLELYVEGDATAEEMVAAGYDAALVARVVRLVDLSEYKRRQMAPGVRVSKKAFGRDRRMPITNQFTASKP